MGSLRQLMASKRDAAVVTVQRVRWLQFSRLLTLDQALVANSRALIAESRRLLATFDEHPASPRHSDETHRGATAKDGVVAIEPVTVGARAEADRNPAMLSVCIVENGSCFGWTIHNSANEVVGSGTAGTEFDARVGAFRAGMDYIDQLKGRTEPKISPLH